MDLPGKSDHPGHDGRDAESYLRRIKAEIRKTNKPIMEKKRRARINNYLNDLKALLLDAMKKDPIRHSKLEKADILDLTVKHLQDLERRKLAIAMAVDPTVADKFKSGFNECIEEIDKYLNTVFGVDSGMKQRISNHLKSYLKYQRFPSAGAAIGPFGSLFGRSTDEINNNGRLTMDAMPLIPSLLPSGELAFIMPHNNTNGLPVFPRIPLGQNIPPLNVNHFKPIQQEKQPFAPSPPLSPVSDHDSTKGDPKMSTPLAKIRPALAEHLMAAFPTPPTPEDNIRASAFRPNHKLIDRIRLQRESIERDDRPPDSKRRRIAKEEEHSEDDDSEQETNAKEADDGKDNAGGDMWRPW